MPQPSRPNILYLHSHDTGRYIQPYGYAVATPNLQRFAQEGVLFRNAFTVNPTCSPSRAALLTGSWPHCNGMVGLAHRGNRLNDYRQHLIHTLKPLGYHTALCGIQHIAHEPKSQPWQTIGYDELVPLGDGSEGACDIGREDLARARGAVEFLKRPHDRPFFLSVGFFATHRTGVRGHNGEISPAGDARFVRPPAHLPDTPRTRQDFADFAVAAGRLDRYMGMVLEGLDQAGLRGNTLVIITTDHGIAFPGMKCNLTDHGLGVMLMLRGPGRVGQGAGRVIDAMVTHLDVFPTVCDVVEAPHPAWLQGKSLLPLIAGQTDSLHDAIYAEVNYHAAYEPLRAVRTNRYKYIRRFDLHSHPVLPNCDDSLSKDVLLEYGWRQRTQEEEQLFDLAFDPQESCNRIHDPACQEVVEDLRRRLDEWMRSTNDPLLAGRVPPRPGSVVNPVDGLSPNEPRLRLA